MMTFKKFLVEEPPGWHGSPHNFDEFKIHRIGTGEGNQSYGWGLYFSSSRKVAEYYRDMFYDYDFIEQINIKLTKIVKQLNPYRTHEYGKYNDPKGYELHKEYDALVAQKTQNRNLYHVDLIPEEDDFLDRDASFERQSDKVKSILNKIASKYPDIWETSHLENWGRTLYEELDYIQGSAEKASKYLLSIGIPGMKYKGRTSKVINYVIFDDSLIKIKEKYD